jgi:DNA-binding NarL/FixJ family response regulator
MEEMFAGCRYGNLDYRADLIDGKLTHDAPRCNLISSCVGFNVVCRIPIPKYGKLTRKEYEIIIYLGMGKQIKEISELLNITDATTRTHIQHIHAKLGVNNNIEVASWTHENRII